MEKFKALIAFNLSLFSVFGIPLYSSALENRTIPDPNKVTINSVSPSEYILGPGDSVEVELIDIPELSGFYTIGPDGTLYLPRVRALYVEGLTIEELRLFLITQFKEFVKDPDIYIRPVKYRGVRVYVGGEVARPGYYTLSGLDVSDKPETVLSQKIYGSMVEQKKDATDLDDYAGKQWPTIYNAIQSANGVTPYSDLSKVTIYRKRPISQGGGRKKAEIDFNLFMTSGNEMVNLRVFDGDTITVSRSSTELQSSIVTAAKTNLSPRTIYVYVTGRVKMPGALVLPQGSTLNQALASAGGLKFLRGGVTFIRVGNDAKLDRRKFSYSPKTEPGEFKNPILMDGDLVQVDDSLLSTGVEVLNDVTGPAVGIYSVYSIFRK